MTSKPPRSPDSAAPVLLWVRRDFRLTDNAALTAACDIGRPVIPVFILDEVAEARGAAPKWRLHAAIDAFDRTLRGAGSRLVLRKGNALEVLARLVEETGACAVYWARDLAPDAIARDTAVKAALKAQQLEARSFGGQVMWEPWSVQTKTGGPYRVYSPFWKSNRTRDPGAVLPPPSNIPAPPKWPQSDALEAWDLGAAMHRGGAVLSRFAQPAGEAAARDALEAFLATRLTLYSAHRDRMDVPATSGLSAYLALGEISPRTLWHRGQEALEPFGAQAEKFLSEVAWREFAYHLLYHYPRLSRENWKEGWDRFPWSTGGPAFDAWTQGRTGVDIVDAAMREMYVTGTMHNRARMIVASYLTKHLLTDWRLGCQWFEDCLVDWDPAANAMGWQWVAGCGPDAAPYFRIFNPETQAGKFDPFGQYRDRYLDARNKDGPGAAYYDAVPLSWTLSPSDPPAQTQVSLPQGRARALAAYEEMRAAPVQASGV